MAAHLVVHGDRLNQLVNASGIQWCFNRPLLVSLKRGSTKHALLGEISTNDILGTTLNPREIS